MNVPLLDLKAQYQTIREEIRTVIDAICDSQYFILGPHVEAMETKIAAYCQTPYAVGVSSGSDALIIALMAAGIGPGDAVITTPYTFFATAGAVARVGARPIFVDIEPAACNLDPQRLQDVVAAMDDDARAAVKAIIPVHLYGQCADMDPILELARRHDWVVIEDAAQAIGAEYKGRRAGSMGDFGCFSFFPSKNLGAFGDGGVVTTRSAEMDQRLRMLRMHGMEPKYYHQLIGGNFRLDALQAAVVAVKLDHLDRWTQGRQENAATYRRLFREAGLEGTVQLPVELQNRHIYNQFVIRVDRDRDGLRDRLAGQGIGTEVYYPVPLHMQTCFAYLGCRAGDFPESERAAGQTLALPIYPELSEAQLAMVVDRIREWIGQ
ncbi:MAG: DegT/DnrJ/EryC1/StrS family aminotransferase [Desulfatitalea sp.]|nr:DegT/DnrJ/EryC1/StrS family aminotransferase [Desulfatitalea sp.]